jgi:NAD-dependent dihydropyrimidine dehydrogenase PreA subunit
MVAKDTSEKKVRYRGKIPKNPMEIYYSWCIKCKVCTKVCPQRVLFMGEDGYPELLKPEECTACFVCAQVCPGFAITFINEKNKSMYRTGKFLEGRF